MRLNFSPKYNSLRGAEQKLAMKRKKNSSVGRRKKSSASTLPIDLIIDILSRLSAKSIQVFRTVSKQWASLLQCPDFKESFLTISLSRPRLLFTFRYRGNWHFFSSPQPLNFDDEKSVVATNYHMGYVGDRYMENCQSVHGFIYLKHTRSFKGKINTVHEICNPCTGQRITLPKVTTKTSDFRITFFGYDPIVKQFKVLCCTRTISNKYYQVLTLGSTGKLLWRMIECSFPHYPNGFINRICINGILYYVAYIINSYYTIVCFDVRSEKFINFIEIENAMILTLINYKGKLGVVLRIDYGSILAELWVLDDAKKVKWSKHMFVLANRGRKPIKPIWATGTGEIVWASNPTTHTLYVFYYNLERQSVRRVEIKGINKLLMGRDHQEVSFNFTNHVENLMVL